MQNHFQLFSSFIKSTGWVTTYFSIFSNGFNAMMGENEVKSSHSSQVVSYGLIWLSWGTTWLETSVAWLWLDLICDLTRLIIKSFSSTLVSMWALHSIKMGEVGFFMLWKKLSLNWKTWNEIDWLALDKLMANTVFMICSFSPSFDWPKNFQSTVQLTHVKSFYAAGPIKMQ